MKKRVPSHCESGRRRAFRVAAGPTQFPALAGARRDRADDPARRARRDRQRVNESELATRFGISRGPVREALRALEECGLVRSEKNRGVFVREISIADADEIYDLREALDELIGRRLALQVTESQLRVLKALVAEMDDATKAKDVKRHHGLNLEFHDALVDFVANSRLSDTYRRLTKELLLFRLRGLQEGGGFAVSNAEHKEMVEAIASRDPDRAGRVMRAHAANSRARMHKATDTPTVKRTSISR